MLTKPNEVLDADDICVTFVITFSNFEKYEMRRYQSKVTGYIISMSRYCGSIVLDDTGCPEIEYRIAYYIIVSNSKLEKKLVTIVSNDDSSTIIEYLLER